MAELSAPSQSRLVVEACIKSKLLHNMLLMVCLKLLHSRSGVWEKQHSGDDERKRLLTQTRDLVSKGLQSDHEWHTVSHADYARPMLQVNLQLHYVYPEYTVVIWTCRCSLLLAQP